MLGEVCVNQNVYKLLKYLSFSLNQQYSIKQFLKYVHLQSHGILDSEKNIYINSLNIKIDIII